MSQLRLNSGELREDRNMITVVSSEKLQQKDDSLMCSSDSSTCKKVDYNNKNNLMLGGNLPKQILYGELTPTMEMNFSVCNKCSSCLE